jgi:uncharacterized membrane protein
MRGLTAGVVLGIGLGGFVDGIALHQIAQWHNTLSAVVPPTTIETMRQNMWWDGLFHFAMLSVTIAGVFMLWSAGHLQTAAQTASGLTGEMLFGWGLFNVFEGVIDHHLLQLHHVRDLPMHEPLYDWLFLAIGGVGLIVAGRVMMRPSRRAVNGTVHY